MELVLPKPTLITRSILLNALGLALVYFMPALSHMTALPLYYAEPMRLMIVLGLVYTNRANTLLLGLTLPIFSFLISSHPSIAKASLIAAELTANAVLFYYWSGRMKSVLASALISIAVSKILYYSLKSLMLSTGVMSGELIATPLAIQVVVTLLLSLFIWKFLPAKK